ncbi:MAG: 50S ribosome-binding GTPase [Planctomycetes bacterium]|nr:50S ribosome-binding GTPase [Planctomycetota bacterium]
MQNNYFALTTPPGQGGISVIELIGPDAHRIIAKIFRHNSKSAIPNSQLSPGHLYLGKIYNNTDLIDEVIIHYIPTRHSFSGLDTVEISAHGGIVSANRIKDCLSATGAKEITARQLINLAARNRKINPTQKLALKELLDAKTTLAAQVLLDQYTERATLPKRFVQALTQPKRIVITGKPNAGKSTLFNALVGKDRAIVHHTPGTTRDTIEETISINGFPFILVDTAGLGNKTDRISNKAIKFSRKEITKADLVLHLIDASETDKPCKLPELKKLTKDIRVYNKIDLFTSTIKPSAGSIQVSALKGAGIDALKKAIISKFGFGKFKYRPGRALAFSE